MDVCNYKNSGPNEDKRGVVGGNIDETRLTKTWQLLVEKLGDRYTEVHYTIFVYVKNFLTKMFKIWEDE